MATVQEPAMTAPDNLIDAYGDYAGVSGIEAYLKAVPAKSINIDLRRAILKNVEETHAGGKRSTRYKEIKRLLEI